MWSFLHNRRTGTVDLLGRGGVCRSWRHADAANMLRHGWYCRSGHWCDQSRQTRDHHLRRHIGHWLLGCEAGHGGGGGDEFCPVGAATAAAGVVMHMVAAVRMSEAAAAAAAATAGSAVRLSIARPTPGGKERRK